VVKKRSSLNSARFPSLPVVSPWELEVIVVVFMMNDQILYIASSRLDEYFLTVGARLPQPAHQWRN